MSSTTPKAIIFDCGEVLLLAQDEADLEAMASLCGIERQLFLKFYWSFRDEYDSGRFDVTAYWKRVADAAGRSLDAITVMKLAELDFQSWARENTAVISWARRLRRDGIRTAILSNMPLEEALYLRDRLSWLEEFNPVLISGEIRCVKPNPDVFRRCLELLNVEPERTLLIDDRLANVKAAELWASKRSCSVPMSNSRPKLRLSTGFPRLRGYRLVR